VRETFLYSLSFALNIKTAPTPSPTTHLCSGGGGGGYFHVFRPCQIGWGVRNWLRSTGDRATQECDLSTVYVSGGRPPIRGRETRRIVVKKSCRKLAGVNVAPAIFFSPLPGPHTPALRLARAFFSAGQNSLSLTMRKTH
jgi:hypothetical protein